MSIALVRSVLNSVVVQWRRLDDSLRDLGDELGQPFPPATPALITSVAAEQVKQIKSLRQLCSAEHIIPPPAGATPFNSPGQVQILQYAIGKIAQAPLRPFQRIFQALNLLRGGLSETAAAAAALPPFKFNAVDIRTNYSTPSNPFNLNDALGGYSAVTFQFGSLPQMVVLVNPSAPGTPAPLVAGYNIVGSIAVARSLIATWFATPAARNVGGGVFAPTGGFAPVDHLPVELAAPELIALLAAQVDDLGEFIDAQIDLLTEMISDESLFPNIRGIRQGVEDIGAYPVLTSEMSTPSRGGGGGGGAGMIQGSGGVLARVVDGALRGVLGRSPRAGDTRSFAVALRQSFNVIEVQGRTEVKYESRSFAGQSDLGGGVTGAQASLYSRASVALDKALPLLDDLDPLDPAADDELVEATRAIVRQEFMELVQALATEGGPTAPRVDQFVESLFGDDAADPTADVRGDRPKGHFAELVSAFGMTDDRINTLDEESNYSNYLAVFDFANQVRTGWIEFRDTFQGKDLGTRLVQLSRALSVAAETVDEVYASMDSVFVGPAERQVSSFTPIGGRQPVLVSELLEWVVAFTTEEAPRLVQDGGRRGIRAIQPTAQKLEGLIRDFLEAIDTDPGIPQGMRHARVRFPLRELRTYIGEIQHLADVARRTPRQLTP